MAIKTELSNYDFLTLYGSREPVSKFSDEAKVEILDSIEAIQDETGDYDLDWAKRFENSIEYKPCDIFNDLRFEIDTKFERMIELTDEIELGECIESKIDDLKEIDTDDEHSWLEMKDDLLGNVNFLRAAEDYLAEEENLTQLFNGNWLMLG